jgi:hypothetical protein
VNPVPGTITGLLFLGKINTGTWSFRLEGFKFKKVKYGNESSLGTLALELLR